MTGSWDSMLEDEQARLDPAVGFEEWRDGKIHGHLRYISNAAKAWHAGIRWVLKLQGEWESLPSRDALHELRKGEASLFWPIFQADQRLSLDCPRDGYVVVTAEGICDRCNFDFDR